MSYDLESGEACTLRRALPLGYRDDGSGGSAEKVHHRPARIGQANTYIAHFFWGLGFSVLFFFSLKPQTYLGFFDLPLRS